MTYSWKENPESTEIRDTAEPIIFPIIEDFQETWDDFQVKTLIPVVRLFQVSIQNFFMKTRMGLSHSFSLLNRPKNTSVATNGLFIDRTVQIYRVSPQPRSAKKHQVKANKSNSLVVLEGGNPWLQRGVKVLQPRQKARDKSESLTWVGASKPQHTRIQAVVADDEIRGLDDIFTRPAQGSFLDVIAPDKKTLATSAKNTSKPSLAQTNEKKNKASSAPHVSSIKTHKPPCEEAEQAHLAIENTFPVPQAVQEQKIQASKIQANKKNASAPVELRSAKPAYDAYDLVAVGSDELELTSCDWMLRNNRILSNSISNLVDQYFQQSALENNQ